MCQAHFGAGSLVMGKTTKVLELLVRETGNKQMKMSDSDKEAGWETRSDSRGFALNHDFF